MDTPSDKIEKAKTLLKDIEDHFTKQNMGRSDIGSIRFALRTTATSHYKDLIEEPTPETLLKLVKNIYLTTDGRRGIGMLIEHLTTLVNKELEEDSPLKYW